MIKPQRRNQTAQPSKSMKTTIDPFTKPTPYNPAPSYTYRDCPLFTYRGVEVYANYSGGWDYVCEGMTITQRAGFSKLRAPSVIDGILDGKDTGHFPWVNDTVANHLRSLGFTPIT